MCVSIHKFNEFYNKLNDNDMGVEFLCLQIKIITDFNDPMEK